MSARIWTNLQRKSSRKSGWQLVGRGEPSEVVPNDNRTVRPLTYKEIERMGAADAEWHMTHNKQAWQAALDEEQRRRTSKRHITENRVTLQWQGHATDEENEAAIKMGAEFAKRFPQFERSLANAQAMCRYMQENDLPGTELSSYITAFRALSEKGELTLAKTESADDFLKSHPELLPKAVPPIVAAKLEKAKATEEHFAKAQSASAQAGSTTVVDYPHEQHGVPPLNEIEKASLRQKVRSMTGDELAAKCSAAPRSKKLSIHCSHFLPDFFWPPSGSPFSFYLNI